MSAAVERYVKTRKRLGKEERRERLGSPEERGALRKMREEARRAGVKLENNGEGGLPSSLVLKVMRRDHYRCKRCGGKRGKPITVHHKGGIVESDWLNNKGHKNEANNIVTLCTACHDDAHEDARAEGVDSSQVTAKADKGNPKHDPEARK